MSYQSSVYSKRVIQRHKLHLLQLLLSFLSEGRNVKPEKTSGKIKPVSVFSKSKMMALEMPALLEEVVSSVRLTFEKICSDFLEIPLGALPSKAKIVAKQYQFEKRYEANDSDFSDSEEEEGYSRPQNRTNTLQIGDFIPQEVRILYHLLL